MGSLFTALFIGDECDPLVLAYNSWFCGFLGDVDVMFDAMTIVATKDPDPVQLYVNYNPPNRETEGQGYGGGSRSDEILSCTVGKIPSDDGKDCVCLDLIL